MIELDARILLGSRAGMDEGAWNLSCDLRFWDVRGLLFFREKGCGGPYPVFGGPAGRIGLVSGQRNAGGFISRAPSENRRPGGFGPDCSDPG